MRTVLVAATILAFVAVRSFHIFVVNRSPSMPAAIYIRSFEEPDVGSIVTIPAPQVLMKWLEVYPNALNLLSNVPLIKHVIAVDGDVVCRNDNEFSVNGRVRAYVERVAFDGRAYPSWEGCYSLTDSQIAVFSDMVRDSLDSRLYGPVPLASARTYRLLMRIE